LTSAISQTLKEIEIIIVNDASTDSSLEIIQEFQKRDGRIKLIDFKKNQGNGVGRNTAIQKASAEYVLFLDSDDWLENNAAELTYNKAKEKNYQALVFGYTQHFVFLNKKNKDELPIYKENDPEFYTYFLMHRQGLYSMPWIYLFSRSLLIENNITFSKGIYFEDVIFVAEALYHIGKIGVINTIPLYNYRIRQNSIIQSTSKKKIDDLYTAHIYLKEFG
jgi:glycosyltransferase involved in cell wall biosynthesis